MYKENLQNTTVPSFQVYGFCKTEQVIASTSFPTRNGQQNSEPPLRGHKYETMDCRERIGKLGFNESELYLWA